MDHADENRIGKNPRNIRLQQRVPYQKYLDTIYARGGVLEVEVISNDFTQRRAIFLQDQPRRQLAGSCVDLYFDMQAGVCRCIASARKLLKAATREKLKSFRLTGAPYAIEEISSADSRFLIRLILSFNSHPRE